jgi:hypothetical protein
MLRLIGLLITLALGSISAILLYGFERFNLQNVGMKIFARLSDQSEAAEALEEGCCSARRTRPKRTFSRTCTECGHAAPG